MKYNSILFLPFLVLCACNTSQPEEGRLHPSSATDFAISLESKIPAGRNLIYSPTLLMAWDEIRNTLKKPLELPHPSAELSALHSSRMFKGSLVPGDYEKEINYDDGGIRVKVSFQKSLPFEIPFTGKDLPELIFDKQKVRSFGMYSPYDAAAGNLGIAYYKNDAHFIIRLLPKDTTQEIILALGLPMDGSFAGVLRSVEEALREGVQDKQRKGTWWKYTFNEDDLLNIPVIDFDLRTNFPELEGQEVIAGLKPMFIEKAEQRTAFSLNESGAEVSSEAEIAMVVDSAEAEKPVPQKFVFNRPFVVIAKRRSAAYPYFMMTVKNAELLKKALSETTPRQ
jgi:hypothetical protein